MRTLETTRRRRFHRWQWKCLRTFLRRRIWSCTNFWMNKQAHLWNSIHFLVSQVTLSKLTEKEIERHSCCFQTSCWLALQRQARQTLLSGWLKMECVILWPSLAKGDGSIKRCTSLITTSDTSKDSSFICADLSTVAPWEVAISSWTRRPTLCFIPKEFTIHTIAKMVLKQSPSSSWFLSSAIQSPASCLCTTTKEQNISKTARAVPGTATLPLPTTKLSCHSRNIRRTCW